MKIEHLDVSVDGDLLVEVSLLQNDALTFQPDAGLQVFPAAGGAAAFGTGLSGSLPVAWLPRGRYALRCRAGLPGVPAGDYQVRLTVTAEVARERTVLDERSAAVRIREPAATGGLHPPAWSLESMPGTMPVEELAWRRGHEDWFFRHFDHAALVVTDYLLQQDPLLRGRILDVGCGDGITDLGVCLRCDPEELVGIDPFEGFRRLPEIMAANHVPADALPAKLRFEAADANELPFPDDRFDVVLSWGSLEHIAGGYQKALTEIRRVLKDGGLLFVHPGLYYSNYGHHLGEFSDEPHFHLTRSRQEIKEIVFGTEPRYMDRAGEFSSPLEYWQWFNELNPITVSGFEQQLRALGFEFYRAALRTEDLIEYHHPALQQYPMQDLATVELYLSAWNRKCK